MDHNIGNLKIRESSREKGVDSKLYDSRLKFKYFINAQLPNISPQDYKI